MAHKFYKLLALFVFISGIIVFVLYRANAIGSQPVNQSVSTSDFSRISTSRSSVVASSSSSMSTAEFLRRLSLEESPSDFDAPEWDGTSVLSTSKSLVLIRQEKAFGRGADVSSVLSNSSSSSSSSASSDDPQ
jgi:hypothetical protein